MIDPFKFIAMHWPDVKLTSEQIQIIHSVWRNQETVVPAGNMLGKDFVSSLIVLTFFLTHFSESCRVVTTSVKDDHLDVLWGEIDARIRESKYELLSQNGGPLIYNHHEIRKIVDGVPDKLSYVKGQVSKRGEGMSGHHAKWALAVIDEASGVEQIVYEMITAWAWKILIIGNCWPCNNFFRTAVKGNNFAEGKRDPGGDIPDTSLPKWPRFHRKVIRIKAEDSPNVKLGLIQEARGETPTDEVLVPGVLTYSEYKRRRAMWDRVRQCVGLDADWYEGGELLLFPPEWLNRAEQLASSMNGAPRRGRRTMGHDSGEGQADSAWYIVDDLGILHHESFKTPDTSMIPNHTVALMKRWDVKPEDVYLDRGGGGKEHADILRARGYNVNTVAFGETASPPRKVHNRIGQIELTDRVETRYAYKNRRAEMYGMLSERLNPANETHKHGFAIPSSCTELRRQLAPIPKWMDGEGRLFLPPKNKRPDVADSSTKTMVDLVGHSPDEADALVLAVYGLEQEAKVMLGVF